MSQALSYLLSHILTSLKESSEKSSVADTIINPPYIVEKIKG